MPSTKRDTTSRFDRQVRTVSWFRERLKRDADKRGAWKVLTREMLNSPAFAELNRSGLIVVLAMLDKLDESKALRKKKKGALVGNIYKENGFFVLLGNELKARGLKSDSAIAEGRRQAWELGFFDTIRQGTVTHYGEFRYSERWKRYPNGNYLPEDQQEPGASLYHRFPKRKGIDDPAENAGNGSYEKHR